ncbi:NAD(P)H-dependent glycerol-3-phosphate dehydrogenase [Cellulosimicrobium arenosum]|uniref:Glycerol-3-phosphate dehydrogenase [NAD(P)+] n=1 Tax=Cellulosimicrobium arenosum TaxID=2708133 RepID=A0A927J2H6_9MICO|nr:NAD(P)H-dependent glycerol-3-phosphate dehydrogenase [Cellulosimicrobium arenosum]MBD8080739.1 NAD(P)-dependent glycerol-3-phosphate dehydrogenase [Cellulosimicrobium arenosum]
MSGDITMEFEAVSGALVRSTRVAVLGGGSWGTAFAAVLADAGCSVRIWTRDRATAQELSAGRNARYLAGIDLPSSIEASTDETWVAEGAEIVVVALPSQMVRNALAEMHLDLDPRTLVVSLMKGIELTSDQRMSVVLGEALGVAADRIVVVSGPNLAREIAERQPTATVVASTDLRAARTVARACTTDYFRPYTNSDVIGVELCGSVKNVVALAVGMAQGRGHGYNTTATIITRGLVEITRLGLALGADTATFSGLAGMGDLVATCTSPSSRNHGLGRLIGEGLSLEDAVVKTGTTAEGVKSSRSVLDLALSVGVDMPITSGVVDVLYKGLSVDEMARSLVARPLIAERTVTR